MVEWLRRLRVGYRIWRSFKFSMFMIGLLTVGTVVYLSFQPQQHRDLGVSMLTSELEHRVRVCDESIDSLSPDVETTAAFHCAMMWQQSNKLKLYMQHYKLKDHEATLALVSAIHAAYRFSEYQAMLNHPAFQPKDED